MTAAHHKMQYRYNLFKIRNVQIQAVGLLHSVDEQILLKILTHM